MPLYRREGSPYWQYSFTVNGVRFRGSTGREGKREAAAVEATKRHEAKQSIIPNDRWTLHHCLGVYWTERAKRNASASIILGLLAELRRHLGEDTPIMALTNAKLMDYRAARRGAAERDPKRRSVEPHTVNRDYACLKAALNHARTIHGQQVPSLAWKNIMLKEPPHRRRFASFEEYERLLAACDADLKVIVRFAVATGLRRENILSLDWAQVDLSSAMVSVIVKGDKFHTVKLTPEWRAAFSVVQDRRGKVFNRTNFRRRWARAKKLAGLHDFRFHDLRHTFASWARLSGADLADICEALGHSNIAVTMRYAHIEPTTHITAFDRISGAVWAQSASQSRKDGTND